MTTDYLSELKNAVITALAEDETLAGMSNGVYDAVPQNVTYPFVALENMAMEAEDSLARKGFRAVFTVNAYSRAREGAEAAAIIAEVRRVVLAGDFGLAGVQVISITEAKSVVMRGKDSSTWNGSVSFVVVMRDESEFR